MGFCPKLVKTKLSEASKILVDDATLSNWKDRSNESSNPGLDTGVSADGRSLLSEDIVLNSARPHP